MGYLVWGNSEFIYILLRYHWVTCSVPDISPKCKLNSAKNIPSKWYHIGLPRQKGGFSGLGRLSDSQIISLQIPKALYQTRRNEVLEEQYQINNPSKSYVIPLQVFFGGMEGDWGGITPCKAEQPLQGMEFQEKEAQKIKARRKFL